MTLAKRAALKLRSRRYNRHKNKNFSKLVQSVQFFVDKNEPIHVVGYWGVTDKEGIDERDVDAIRVLNKIGSRVKEDYDLGVKFTFVIADSHTEMNGYNWEEFMRYVCEIKELFDKYENFDYVLLSDLRKEVSLEDIDEVVFGPDQVLDKMLLSGAKRLFRGDPFEGIKIYVKTRFSEIKIFDEKFPNSIFFTYNHPAYIPLFPKIPVLHLYSGSGTTKPPWLK